MARGWVCPECGLDYDTITKPDAAVAVRSYPRRFREQLTGVGEGAAADAVLRRRPEPATWSALEYTCHVRDVFEWMADTLGRMTVEDNPTIEWFDQDRRAVDERYGEQDPGTVLDQLATAAARLATTIEAVDASHLGRTATFEWGERDVLTMIRNAVHEGYHHLRDVERVLATVRRPG